MSTFIVGGTFDSGGGKESKLISNFARGIALLDNQFEICNGGSLSELHHCFARISEFDIIIWLANVPDNNQPKKVLDIKKIHPRCLLVTSKRNIDGKYTLQQVIAHALQRKSNLVIEIDKPKLYKGRLLDPLGNCFFPWNSSFSSLGFAVALRLQQLTSFTRMGSRMSGQYSHDPAGIDKYFFDLIQSHADTFHDLIPEIQTTRFLGNASFRCRHGFPSFRDDNRIFVSPRNVDKRGIKREDFVLAKYGSGGVEYIGDRKPSVDTPIQLALYHYYYQVNYMLHGHVYADDCSMTENVISCGALEEIVEILKVENNPMAYNFTINLRGHGFIALAREMEYLEDLTFKPRPAPEVCYED
jgi:Class II Aldolase and Adducin N-terminal domain